MTEFKPKANLIFKHGPDQRVKTIEISTAENMLNQIKDHAEKCFFPPIDQIELDFFSLKDYRINGFQKVGGHDLSYTIIEIKDFPSLENLRLSTDGSTCLMTIGDLYIGMMTYGQDYTRLSKHPDLETPESVLLACKLLKGVV